MSKASMIRAALLQRYPDRKISYGAQTAMAREFGTTKSHVCELAKSLDMQLVEPSHGSVGRYQYLACRCAPCVKANSAYQKERRAARRTASKVES